MSTTTPAPVKEKTRPVPPGLRLTGAFVLVRDDEKRILIIKRVNGGFEIPGGGVKDGESKEEAASRETHSEIGLHLIDLTEVGVYPQRVVEKFEGGTHLHSGFAHMFTKNIRSGLNLDCLKLSIHEVASVHFMTVDEILERFARGEFQLGAARMIFAFLEAEKIPAQFGGPIVYHTLAVKVQFHYDEEKTYLI